MFALDNSSHSAIDNPTRLATPRLFTRRLAPGHVSNLLSAIRGQHSRRASPTFPDAMSPSRPPSFFFFCFRCGKRLARFRYSRTFRQAVASATFCIPLPRLLPFVREGCTLPPDCWRRASSWPAASPQDCCEKIRHGTMYQGDKVTFSEICTLSHDVAAGVIGRPAGSAVTLHQSYMPHPVPNPHVITHL